MGDRRDISCLPSLRTQRQEAPRASAASPQERRSKCSQQSLALPGATTDKKEKDFTFSFEESVGWTNFLYSTLEPFV